MSEYIYHGPWINWEHGLVRGATLTLSERSGALLTAFIATFVTIVGAELWKILCYALHQYRSSEGQKDGLYHQQQVILRTSTTPGGASWLFLQQSVSWAGLARRSFLRTVPLALLGFMYIIAVGLAAVFSSAISKSPGPHRLIVGGNCGIWVTNTSSPYRIEAFRTKSSNDSLVAATYAKACYGGSQDPQVCGKLPVPSINYTSNANATCPFRAGMCLFGNTAAYEMTSRRVNSHHDLGINARPSDRIEVEKTTTCAPLTYKNFTKVVNISAVANDPYYKSIGRPGDFLIEFQFGGATGNTTNLTYTYNDHTSFDGVAYTMEVVSSNTGTDAGLIGWTPEPAVNSADGDVALMFIATNSIVYDQPCRDPVFAAQYKLNGTLDDGTPWVAYSSDRYVNVLGCTEQYRVCNPLNNKCTPKLGLMQLEGTIRENDDSLSLGTLQNATALRMINALQVSSIYYATSSRLGNALRATESLHGLQQAYLPPTQWQIESSGWFDAGLARLQQKTQEYATGPRVVPRGSYVSTPHPETYVADIPWESMCGRQWVNDSSDTTSFSIVGLGILFGVGILIILFATIMDTIFGFIQTRFRMGLHSWAEWRVNDRLQMQRLLHEATGLGNWEDGWFYSVPVTRKGETFSGPGEKHLRNLDSRDGQGAGVQLVEQHFDMKDRPY